MTTHAAPWLSLIPFLLLASAVAAQSDRSVPAPPSSAELPRMHWADDVSGLPCSKDPAVVKFHDHYWLYYSIPPYQGKKNTGWTIGVARSENLVDWKKVGELSQYGSGGREGVHRAGRDRTG